MPLSIQTFTHNRQLIFSYGLARLLHPLTIIFHETGIDQLRPSQTRPQPFPRHARLAGAHLVRNLVQAGIRDFLLTVSPTGYRETMKKWSETVMPQVANG
jgi:hypothetical protein